jgi:hypothetical protein
MPDTLLLDRTSWDLTTDSAGNLARAGEPYATLQDVSSACRLFYGELYYRTDRGIRYFTTILGKPVSVPALRSQLAIAAQSVPNVVSAQPVLSDATARRVTGQVQCVLADGTVGIAVV